jgi:hypothetical protein
MHIEQRDESIAVECRPSTDGWTCSVKVGNAEDATEHEVAVSHDELERLAPGATDATRLVEASVRYLLEHEPKESILPRFGIRTIASYFPSYPEEIRSRL